MLTQVCQRGAGPLRERDRERSGVTLTVEMDRLGESLVFGQQLTGVGQEHLAQRAQAGCPPI